MTVFILWEDRAIGQVTRFGPHVFLTACVAVRIGLNRYELARSEVIDGRACAGNSNVMRELRRAPLWNSAVHVVAVLDTDKIHDRIAGIDARRMVLDADHEPWCQSVITAIRKHAPDYAQVRLEVCLLDRNLETLLALVGPGAHGLEGAVRKSPLDRDKILQRAADDPGLATKACAEMPSWEQLVATVSRLVRAAR